MSLRRALWWGSFAVMGCVLGVAFVVMAGTAH